MALVRSGERTAHSRTDAVLPGQRVPHYEASGWTALGRHVTLVAADASRLDDATTAAKRLLEQIDELCYGHDPQTGLQLANQCAGRWAPVDPLLGRVVRAAARVAAATSGLVDPELGSDLPALRDHSGSPVTGAWKHLEIDPDGALWIPAGMRLDLGGTGRAVAADLIARQVSDSTGTSLVVCIGGDIAVGTVSGEYHRWRISVGEHPDDPRRGVPVTVVLTEGALSTSSTTPRRSQPFGTPTHHQHDPRTGLPVSATWRTASVCAATCVDASAASAAALMLGDQAPAWLWQRSLAARLVTPSGRVLRIAGWPET